MKSQPTVRRWKLTFSIFTITMVFLFSTLLSYRVSVSQDAPSDSSPSEVDPDRQRQPEPSDALEAWNEAMIQLPRPKEGCFTAAYPTLEWNEVLCIAPPAYPMPPHEGVRPLIVGSGNDVSPEAPSGFITSATGSFDTVSNVTSVTSPIGNAGAPVANAYTLQLNTDFFASTACAGSPNPNCRGWEQFVFENNGTVARVFIQYWLLEYNATCPAGGGWNQFSFSGSTVIYCWRNNSLGATPVTPLQPITNLSQMRLTGTVSTGADSATFSTGTSIFTVTGDNSVNAAAGWRAAEFNVFGDGGNSSGGGQATFNNGAEIVARTRIFYGGTAAPNCLAQGFTGETNNLNFAQPAPAASQPGPALIFHENITGGAPSNCAGARAVGDTHLATFDGLFYDFQATGDFILAQVDPDFVVQTRQVSGAPTWPNASVNSAVATRMGKTQVAICLAPEQPELNIDGERTKLDDGNTLPLADNIAVTRVGNVYYIVDQSGNSVRAQVNTTWIDVSVGLGRWPEKVSGLLANANGNVSQLETRDGQVLENPFSFEELYHPYADSWRVLPEESLLSVCGEPTESGAPDKLFTAADLDPQQYEQALAVCLEMGVEDSALRDACILDVAVIGDKGAATIFGDILPPTDVGKIKP